LAVPVAPPKWTTELAGTADEFVCVDTPESFFGVGQWYRDFAQTTDEEVVACLRRSHVGSGQAINSAAGDDPPVFDGHVEVVVRRAHLRGHLTVPEQSPATVVFAHGTGSSRHSPRNRYVAGVLNEAGLATLLVDLLTPQEELDRANVFDINLLAERLEDVTAWVRREPETAAKPVAYFGASTGAGAALWAAAEPDVDIAAVVSRGGRPDLAGPRLRAVRAPTLLIVGGDDDAVVRLNREAQTMLRCESRLTIVPGATHLFEEPGTLEIVAGAAREWFVTHLSANDPRAARGQDPGER
jgi:putative phosphoribosyl transferase